MTSLVLIFSLLTHALYISFGQIQCPSLIAVPHLSPHIFKAHFQNWCSFYIIYSFNISPKLSPQSKRWRSNEGTLYMQKTAVFVKLDSIFTLGSVWGRFSWNYARCTQKFFYCKFAYMYHANLNEFHIDW